ncbi:MAG: bifunctional adenosylcobinamide kinase/adenosylcobinamide-phosphate guanylyltransferase [Bacillota bacterium]|nr:bifunctional adenosylcobinamide kinase/adenosylcobinamide-phosphate guanylyltransferase [Bacillota bacterium]
MILVTGGVRSGKSEFAENYAREYMLKHAYAPEQMCYIATSKRDFGMQARIEAHQARRPAEWRTLEKYRDFVVEDFDHTKVAILDCAGVMATNLMFDLPGLEHLSEGELYADVWREFASLLRAARAAGIELVIVSNEVGWGLVSEHRVGNQFRDLLGAVNKEIARHAQKVFLLVSGIPLCIREREDDGGENEWNM